MMHSTNRLLIAWAVAAIDRAVGGHHAAVGRNRVAGQGGGVGLQQGCGRGNPARRKVFDNGNGGLLETDRGAPGGIQVEQVVIGELFALQNLPAQGRAGRRIGVEGGLLVRVFAVAQGLDRVESQGLAAILRQVGGDGRVVMGGQPEALDGQLAADFQRDAAQPGCAAARRRNPAGRTPG